jgi:hypothetical protein
VALAVPECIKAFLRRSFLLPRRRESAFSILSSRSRGQVKRKDSFGQGTAAVP